MRRTSITRHEYKYRPAIALSILGTWVGTYVGLHHYGGWDAVMVLAVSHVWLFIIDRLNHALQRGEPHEP